MISRLPSFLDELARLDAQQWLLRGTVPAATLLTVVAERLAGAPRQHVGFLLVAVALSLLTAVLPDSSAGLFLVLLLAWHWTVSVPDPLTGWLLLPALAILAIHVGATLASYGPTSLALDRALLRLWGGRCLLAAAATGATWLAATLASGASVPGGAWALGGSLAMLTAWAAYLARRLT
jgi:hypothetical protein